jgi:hypothetical protein
MWLEQAGTVLPVRNFGAKALSLFCWNLENRL